jgi:hypothetical protein
VDSEIDLQAGQVVADVDSAPRRVELDAVDDGEGPGDQDVLGAQIAVSVADATEPGAALEFAAVDVEQRLSQALLM